MNFKEVKLPSNKKFGFFFTFVFTIVGIYLFFHEILFLSFLFLLLAFIFFIISLKFPFLLTTLNKLWMFIGFFLNKIISPIILGTIYFGLITPIGFVRRRFGNDELNLNKNNNNTYWLIRLNKKLSSENFKRQF